MIHLALEKINYFIFLMMYCLFYFNLFEQVIMSQPVQVLKYFSKNSFNFEFISKNYNIDKIKDIDAVKSYL